MSSYEDDDIQEVVPVKSEPGAVVPDNHAMAPADQYGGGGGSQLSDPAAMEYGDEYVDYEGYDGDGTYDGSSLDHSMAGSADGNKGRKNRKNCFCAFFFLVSLFVG
jgi:hypothetical protein